jgi:hypothetical protein
LRISASATFERSFWLEKYKMFGFKKMTKLIKSDCRETLLKGHQGLSKAYKKKLLNFKYWTNTERLAIKSWLEGGLERMEWNEKDNR